VKVALRLCAVAALLTLLAPAPASACTYVEQPAARLEREADLIFTGTVVRATRPPLMASTAEEVTWTFVVDEMQKGDRRERVEVASPMNEASCGFEFQVGHRYRVLAHREGDALRTWLGAGNEELPLLAVRPPIEADYYRIGIALPLPVLIAVPAIVVLVTAVVLVAVALRVIAVRRRNSA
jgi:hypothetical protein